MFENKTILVTGGLEGIGQAVVQEILAKEGNIIIFDNQSIDKFPKFKNNPRIFYYRIDLKHTSSLSALCNTVLEEHPKIFGIVNNVGLFNGNGLNSTVNEWVDSLKVNIIANYVITQIFSKNATLKTIVNVASISGMIAQKNYLIYNTMKGALINMTRCVALDLSEKNIRCNSVSPGTVWTDKNEYFISLSHGINREEADKHPDFGGGNIMSRVCSPTEIAKPIIFLLSDEASFITGENLVVDGGSMAI